MKLPQLDELQFSLNRCSVSLESESEIAWISEEIEQALFDSENYKFKYKNIHTTMVNDWMCFFNQYILLYNMFVGGNLINFNL